MSIQKIAVCTDFSNNAEAAFITGLEMAERYNAKLDVVHVMPPVINPVFTDFDTAIITQPDKSLILKLEERMQNEYGARIKDSIDYELVVLSGHISSEILQYLDENQIDLVILGAYGLTGMGLVVFGSIAKRISHRASCSVMIVRERVS